MLYVNPVFGRYIEQVEGVPMQQELSDAALEYLYQQASHPEYCFNYVYS
jgi:chromosome segregation and condensation protein ScpB